MPRMNASAKTALLVASCDRYRDLWGPFFYLFRRFWPDCPLPLYLLSNTVAVHQPGVTNLQVGPDVSWSDGMRRGLQFIEHRHVFLWLDDLFLVERVAAPAVLAKLEWLAASGGHCLRLNGRPLPDRRLDRDVGVVSPGTLYRTSVVLSVWRRETLLDLLTPGESAWDFESLGAARSDAYGGFYATYRPQVRVLNGVIKGKWERRALARATALGAAPDLSRREIMTPREEAYLKLLRLRTRVLELLPAKSRRRIKELALGGRYRYGPAV